MALVIAIMVTGKPMGSRQHMLIPAVVSVGWVHQSPGPRWCMQVCVNSSSGSVFWPPEGLHRCGGQGESIPGPLDNMCRHWKAGCAQTQAPRKNA